MSRLSFVVLAPESEDVDILRNAEQAAGVSDMAFSAVLGGFEEICETVRDWTILPEILMVEVPSVMEAGKVLETLGAALPEGEAEVILYNVPNDIRVYRDLKHSGVREVFPGIPGLDEIEDVLDEIATDNLRRTGIDPRKAVYVWSACGGAGGTALAITLAKNFAREGRRTLFIDLDISTGPASFMFNAERGARETSGLMDALANPGRIDALFLERAIEIAENVPGRNLFYLSARKRISDPLPVPEALPALISRAQENFDMVVIDIPWRPSPEPEMMTVQGHSYIVAPPTPAGLLGFSVLAKELEAAPGKSPVYGVINRKGEFRGSDIDRNTFKDAGNIEMFAIPYDASAAGRMFFDQKSYLEMGGRIKTAVQKIVKTLPGEAAEDNQEKPSRRKAAKGRRR